MPKKLTEIPVECPCFVQEVRGEGYLRLFDLGFFRDSRVLPLYECAGGGTRVYRVKDTLIALRDADCAFLSSSTHGGSVQPMINSQCLTDKTTEREAFLASLLQCEEGDLSCPLPPAS